jgi:hypothetical protein
MFLIKIKNQNLIKYPWLFALSTVIGGAYPLYFGGPAAQTPGVIAIAAVVVAVLNIWFYLSLRKTLR